MMTCVVSVLLGGVITCFPLVNPSAKIIHVEPFERVAPAPVVQTESVPLPRPRPQGLGEFVSPLDRPHDTIQR